MSGHPYSRMANKEAAARKLVANPARFFVGKKFKYKKDDNKIHNPGRGGEHEKFKALG